MNKNKGGFFTFVFFLIIIIFLVNLLWNFLSVKSYQTVICEKENYVETFPCEGMIIFNQNVYSLGRDADVLVKEGDKVSVGTPLFVSGINESPELQQINSMIASLEGKTGEDYFQWADDLREAEFKGNYEKAELLLSMSGFSDTAMFYKSTEVSPESDLDVLKERKAELESLGKNTAGANTIYSDMSGIISFSGSKIYPEITSENFESITASDFDFFKDTSGEFLRVIDNFSATVALRIEKDYFEEPPEIGSNIRIKIDEDEFRISISEIKDEGKYYIIFSTIKNELHRLANSEKAKFSLIEFSGEVFKLPKEAIIRDGVKTGVFINFKGSIVRYVPVKILTEGEEFVYVSLGDVHSKIDEPITNEPVTTLRQYDEVFLHPEKLTEDEILNRK